MTLLKISLGKNLKICLGIKQKLIIGWSVEHLLLINTSKIDVAVMVRTYLYATGMNGLRVHIVFAPSPIGNLNPL